MRFYGCSHCTGTAVSAWLPEQVQIQCWDKVLSLLTPRGKKEKSWLAGASGTSSGVLWWDSWSAWLVSRGSKGQQHQKQGKEVFFFFIAKYVLIFIRTALLFCSSQEEAWLGYSIPHHITARSREKGLSSGEKEFFWSRKCGRGSCLILSIIWGFFSTWIVSLLIASDISIVAVTIWFCISLLFQVGCSYVNQWSLPSIPPIFLSSTLQQGGGARDSSV